jgi:hypothetical protein
MSYNLARLGKSASFVQPTQSDVHVKGPLTNISLAYLQNANNFIAHRVFPVIPVNKQADSYFTYERGDFNRDEMRERAAGSESSGGTYEIGDDTYFARTYAYHKDVPDLVRANQDNPINLDREASMFVVNKGLIKRERTWVTKYFTGGQAPGVTWTFVADGVASSPTAASSFDPTNASNNNVLHWNDAASTPIEDIRKAKRFVLESTGFMPNIMTLGRAVYDTLVDHPDIVGRIDRGQTSGPVQASRENLAALFEVEEILVMDSIVNTANKGATAVHAFIGGKHALLSYRPPSPGLLTPSAGYTFAWNGLFGSVDQGFRVKRFRMEHLASDRVEIEMSYDQKKVSAELGYFFNGIVA